MDYNTILKTGLVCAVLGLTAGHAIAQDSVATAYYDALKGKKVGFVPISMGFDLTQGWLAGMQRQADDLGYEIIVRDPNWSVESGIQAITSLIEEAPDLLVIQNNDNQSYNRLVQQAAAAGIPVIQVQQSVDTRSDAYIGPDWYKIGTVTAQALVDKCGAGTSGKIAVVEGATAAPASILLKQGIEDLIAQHPEITIVSSQAADWDATKAFSITATVLQQNPDLCGIAGFWDVADTGTAGAIREAGLEGKVVLATSGGGSREAGCAKVESGEFAVYHSHNTAGQARDLNDAIKMLLQVKLPAGSAPFALYSPLIRITKENMTPSSCWTLDEIAKIGG